MLYFEIIGVFIALVYLYLEYKASFWLWTAGIVMSLFYIVIFYISKFYADAGIYAYYLGANIYGLICWKKQPAEESNPYAGITRVDKKYYLPMLLSFLGIATGLWLILSQFTDSPVPVGDSVTTALSIIAMWLLAKKHIEHWILWILVNGISAPLYLWKELYPTAILFFVYTIISIMGYFRWKKGLEKNIRKTVEAS